MTRGSSRSSWNSPLPIAPAIDGRSPRKSGSIDPPIQRIVRRRTPDVDPCPSRMRPSKMSGLDPEGTALLDQAGPGGPRFTQPPQAWFWNSATVPRWESGRVDPPVAQPRTPHHFRLPEVAEAFVIEPWKNRPWPVPCSVRGVYIQEFTSSGLGLRMRATMTPPAAARAIPAGSAGVRSSCIEPSNGVRSSRSRGLLRPGPRSDRPRAELPVWSSRSTVGQ